MSEQLAAGRVPYRDAINDYLRPHRGKESR
jgi:hypothetical protein